MITIGIFLQNIFVETAKGPKAFFNKRSLHGDEKQDIGVKSMENIKISFEGYKG